VVSLSSVVLIIGFILFLGVFFYHQTNIVKVDTVEVSIADLPEEFENFTIIQITDLHGKSFGREQARLIKLIDRQKFDILVLTGDMFKDNDDLASMSELRPITDHVFSQGKKVYFVAGNHDLAADYNRISTELAGWGINILDNQTHILKRNEAVLNIIGIKDALFGMANLEQAIANVQKGIKILLAHTIFKRKDKSLFQTIIEHKIDLVLTGHTHGAQINIFPISRLYMSGEGLFPKYVKGLHKIEDLYIYVSRGLGTSGFHLRMFCRPELTCVKLVCA
jgi:predicted MPP superfamily phosphohydrolase